MWKTTPELARQQYDNWSLKYDWDGQITNVPIGRLLHMGLDEPDAQCGKHGGGCDAHIAKLQTDIEAGKPGHPVLAYEDPHNPGYYVPNDGNHRIAAAIRAGADPGDDNYTVPTIIVKPKTRKSEGGMFENIHKVEQEFEKLIKFTDDPALIESLKHLDGAAKLGHIDPAHVARIRKALATDKMIPSMGNKAAYLAFEKQNRPGVHIRMDGNDFGMINKAHGHGVGDKAIVHFGNAIREALDETVGRKNAKAFRFGGDEFHAHVPDHESAARFARAVRQKLEAIPPIGGTHSLSMSMGFGHTAEHADQAAMHAKSAKKAANYKAGLAKTHAHSLVPGFEGAVPVHDNMPLKRPAVADSAPTPKPPQAVLTPPLPAVEGQVNG